MSKPRNMMNRKKEAREGDRKAKATTKNKQEVHGALRSSHVYNVILTKVTFLSTFTGAQHVVSQHISKVHWPNDHIIRRLIKIKLNLLERE